MTVWLGRQEAVARFRSFQDYLAKRNNPDQTGDLETNDEDRGSVDGDEDEVGSEEVVASTRQLRYTLAAKPGFPSLRIHTIKSDFHATNFVDCLSTFIRRLYPPPSIPILPNTVDYFNLYKRLTISRTSLPGAGSSTYTDRIRTTPKFTAELGRSKTKSTPEHFDTVLVRTEEVDNPHTKGTWLEGTRLITHKLQSYRIEVFNRTSCGASSCNFCGPFTLAPASHSQPSCLHRLVHKFPHTKSRFSPLFGQPFISQ